LKFAPPVFTLGDKSKKEAQGYDVFAKEGRQFKKLNENSLGKFAAINLGVRSVDKDRSKTFRLQKTKDKPTVFNNFINQNVSKFEKMGNTYTELKQYRKDSIKEKRSKARKGAIFDVSF